VWRTENDNAQSFFNRLLKETDCQGVSVR
jgi:hypothetical protein